MNPIPNENKVEKSFRNTKAFKELFERASKGEFDQELSEARENGLEGTSSRLPLLKVTEIWSIRKHFSIASSQDYYKLYKEKFYINNPGSNYVETVDPTIYRKVVAQSEEGDKKWAKAVSAHLGVEVEGAATAEPATETPAAE